jgi:hypothetical protein
MEFEEDSITSRIEVVVGLRPRAFSSDAARVSYGKGMSRTISVPPGAGAFPGLRYPAAPRYTLPADNLEPDVVNPVRVFVSYSHSPDDSKLVFQLVDCLKERLLRKRVLIGSSAAVGIHSVIDATASDARWSSRAECLDAEGGTSR